MTFKRDDLIGFDDEQVMVIDAIEYEGNEYLYVVVVEGEELTPTKVLKILMVNYNDGTLDKVSDNERLSVLVPIFK